MQKVRSGQKRWLGIGLAVLTIAANPATVRIGLTAIALLAQAAPASSATLTAWRFDPNNRQLEITVPEGVTPRYFLLAQPARIVLDLPNTVVGAVPDSQSYSGAVRQIRVGQFEQGLTRIVIELSPDATLAPGQAELRRVGSSGASDRWILRPLLAGSAPGNVAARPSPAPSPAPPPVTSAPSEPPAAIAPAAPPPIATPVPTPPVPAAPASPPAETAQEPAPSPPAAAALALPSIPPDNPSPPNSAPLPPLEPNATEIPVEVPPVVTTPTEPAPAVTTAQLPPAAAPSPQIQSPVAVAPAPTPPASTQPAAGSPALPPPVFLGSQPITVTVPPLNSSAPPNSIPSATQPAEPVLPPAATNPAPDTVITRPPSAQPVPQVAAAPIPTNVLIPSGTVLSLRFPRNTALALQEGDPWQEVLVFNQAIRDQAGNIVAPEGSPVIGRFETSQTGSRFIAQAITIQGRNVQLSAESGALEGDRQVSRRELVRNSAIGAVALTVLGALTGGVGAIVGLAAGAAAGAATTYATSPQPAIIQPNQIVEVRLTEDLPRSF